MWRCRRVAVARVFALVVRCRIMMLFVYSRVRKNRDTRRECPAGAGPGRTAQWFLPGGFSRKAGPIKHQLVLVCRSGGSARKNRVAVRRANDIYRPVSSRHYSGFQKYPSKILAYCFSRMDLSNGSTSWR